jgi:hypothetical protein
MASFLSMVVDYFHVFGAVGAFWPLKTNAPLLVDTDAVLPLAIAAERFKVIAGKGGKILQGYCRLKNAKAPFGLMAKGVELRDALPFRKQPRSLVPVAPYHLFLGIALEYAVRQAYRR